MFGRRSSTQSTASAATRSSSSGSIFRRRSTSRNSLGLVEVPKTSRWERLRSIFVYKPPERESGEWEVGQRYHVLHDLVLRAEADLESTVRHELGPGSVLRLVVKRHVQRPSGQPVLRGLVQEESAFSSIWGWLSFETPGGQQLLKKVSGERSWVIGGRYRIAFEANMRQGEALETPMLRTLQLGEEVVLMEFGSTVRPDGSPSLRCRVNTREGELGWLSPQTSDFTHHLLDTTDLFLESPLRLKRLSITPTSAAVANGGRRVSFRSAVSREWADAPWEVGGKYRVLAHAVMQEREELGSRKIYTLKPGNKVLIHNLVPVLLPNGQPRVRAKVSLEGTSRVGWVNCEGQVGESLLDTRDCLEFEKVSNNLKSQAPPVRVVEPLSDISLGETSKHASSVSSSRVENAMAHKSSQAESLPLTVEAEELMDTFAASPCHQSEKRFLPMVPVESIEKVVPLQHELASSLSLCEAPARSSSNSSTRGEKPLRNSVLNEPIAPDVPLLVSSSHLDQNIGRDRSRDKRSSSSLKDLPSPGRAQSRTGIDETELEHTTVTPTTMPVSQPSTSHGIRHWQSGGTSHGSELGESSSSDRGRGFCATPSASSMDTAICHGKSPHSPRISPREALIISKGGTKVKHLVDHLERRSRTSWTSPRSGSQAMPSPPVSGGRGPRGDAAPALSPPDSSPPVSAGRGTLEFPERRPSVDRGTPRDAADVRYSLTDSRNHSRNPSQDLTEDASKLSTALQSKRRPSRAKAKSKLKVRVKKELTDLLSEEEIHVEGVETEEGTTPSLADVARKQLEGQDEGDAVDEMRMRSRASFKGRPKAKTKSPKKSKQCKPLWVDGVTESQGLLLGQGVPTLGVQMESESDTALEDDTPGVLRSQPDWTVDDSESLILRMS